MKKLLLAGMLLFNVVLFAQSTMREPIFYASETVKTTEEEYNYLTKGLKIQEDSGLDMKKGYQLDAIYKREINKFNFVISQLVLLETKEVKAISVKAYSPVTLQTYYLCIPLNNAELTNKYFEYIRLFTPALCQAYAVAMSDNLAIVTSRLMDFRKNTVK